MVEVNGNQAWNNGEDLLLCVDRLAAGLSLDDNRQILSPPKVTQIYDPSHAVQALETVNKDTGNALETSNTKTCDLPFFSPCVLQNLEKELTAQQHLFPDYAQMRAHIVNSPNPCSRSNDDEKHERRGQQSRCW